jgi:hypothetical protein
MNNASVVTPTSSGYGFSRPRNVPANSPCASTGTPQAMLPSATPSSRPDRMLPTEKLTSHICRHQCSGRLLRNSIATDRKISDASSKNSAR